MLVRSNMVHTIKTTVWMTICTYDHPCACRHTCMRLYGIGNPRHMRTYMHRYIDRLYHISMNHVQLSSPHRLIDISYDDAHQKEGCYWSIPKEITRSAKRIRPDPYPAAQMRRCWRWRNVIQQSWALWRKPTQQSCAWSNWRALCKSTWRHSGVAVIRQFWWCRRTNLRSLWACNSSEFYSAASFYFGRVQRMERRRRSTKCTTLCWNGEPCKDGWSDAKEFSWLGKGNEILEYLQMIVGSWKRQSSIM